MADPIVPLSVLDLAPVGEGSSPAAALQASLTLAAAAERLGYRRYWVAEHHNMPGIASSSPPVLLAHAAGVTSTIRLGSRCHAPEPRPAGGRRAVRHARGPPPRTHRPRHRAGAGHRPAHRAGLEAQRPGVGGRRLPRAARRAVRLLRRRVPRGPPVPPHHRHTRARLPPRRVAPRVERLQRAGRGHARPAVLVRPPLRRRQHASRRRRLPGRRSARPSNSPSPT